MFRYYYKNNTGFLKMYNVNFLTRYFTLDENQIKCGIKSLNQDERKYLLSHNYSASLYTFALSKEEKAKSEAILKKIEAVKPQEYKRSNILIRIIKGVANFFGWRLNSLELIQRYNVIKNEQRNIKIDIPVRNPIVKDSVVPPQKEIKPIDERNLFFREGTLLSISLDDVKKMDSAQLWKELQYLDENVSEWGELKLSEECTISRENLKKCFQFEMDLSPTLFVNWISKMNQAKIWERLDQFASENKLTKDLLASITGRVDKLNFKNFNEVDAKGFEPLHYACYLNHYAVVEALVEAGADVNTKSHKIVPIKQTLQKASDFKIAEFLLTKGAEIDEELKKKIFLTAIEFNKLDVIKKIISELDINDEIIDALMLLYASNKKKAKEILAILSLEPNFNLIIIRVKELINLKIAAHINEIGGDCLLDVYGKNEQQKLQLSGLTKEIFLSKLPKIFEIFSERFPAIMPLSLKEQLNDLFRFSSDNISNPKAYYERIKLDYDTMLIAGFDEHQSAMLIIGNYFIICDRMGRFDPVQIFSFDKSKMSVEIIKKIQSVTFKNKDMYLKLLEELKDDLTLEKCTEDKNYPLKFTQFATYLETISPIQNQKAGNCTFASLEGAIWLTFVFTRLSSIGNIQELNSTDLMELLKEEKERFLAFQGFMRAYSLDKYFRTNMTLTKERQKKELYYKLNNTFVQNAFANQKRTFSKQQTGPFPARPNPEIVTLFEKLEATYLTL